MMLSRFSAEIDFENQNRPVIQIYEKDSDDVRDKILSVVFEKLGHHSRWFRAEFKHNTIDEKGQGAIWHLVPISPDEYEEEIKLMQAHLESLKKMLSQG